MRTLFAFTFVVVSAAAQDWRPLFNGRDLTGWEIRGTGIWAPLAGGILSGSRVPVENTAFTWPMDKRQFDSWRYRQAWLYTLENFGEFDLSLEYWLPPRGNSGISIRDTSRGQCAIDGGETPSHIGYEIQIAEGGKYPAGSIYLFASAPPNLQRPNDWNRLEIESRNDMIRVKLNGRIAAEYAGEPGRPKSGPIGLQLHDQFSSVLFRDIRIRTIQGRKTLP